jgi:hypothetical protein
MAEVESSFPSWVESSPPGVPVQAPRRRTATLRRSGTFRETCCRELKGCSG